MDIVTIGLMCAPVAIAVEEMRVDTMTVFPMNIAGGSAVRDQVDSVATIRPDMKFSDPEVTPSIIWNRIWRLRRGTCPPERSRQHSPPLSIAHGSATRELTSGRANYRARRSPLA